MSAADQIDWLMLSDRCHRLQDRGLSRDAAVDVYYAGNPTIVTGLEAATDAALREVSRLHAARARAAAVLVDDAVAALVDAVAFQPAQVSCPACTPMPLLWDGDQA